MFRSMLRDFNDDSMFGIHHDQMSRMERMMDGLMPSFDDMMFGSPFGLTGFPALMGVPGQRMDGGRRGSRHRPNALLPFGFSNVGPLFTGMDRLAADPSVHSYSSSSVMSYSLGEDGQPKVYQASSSTRTAPGGVKETTKTVSNSVTGEHKMSIGRQLGERAHVMEKTQNRYTGDQDESEEFVNMEDNETEMFNQEWKQRTGASRLGNQISSHPYQRPTLAITDGSHRQDDRQVQKRGKKSNARKGIDKSRQSKSR